MHWHTSHTIYTGHTPSEKGGVCVNVLTVDGLLQLRNSLFSLCKTCNSNSSHKVALLSLLSTLSKLWNFCSLELLFSGIFAPIMCISPFIELCSIFLIEMSLSSFCSYYHVYAVGHYMLKHE